MEKEMIKVEAFLNALFNREDLVEIRILPAGKREWRKVKDFDQEFTEMLKHHNLDGQNIYFGANPRNKRGGSL